MRVRGSSVPPSGVGSDLPMWNSKPRPVLSPVLVVDALGASNKIDERRDPEGLAELTLELDDQFHGFQAKIPHRIVVVLRKRVFGTRDFRSIRLNDMFILYSARWDDDLPGKYLIAGSLAYHQLLRTGFIVRGGLGFGPVVRHRDLFLGRGFLDGYRMAEKRSEAVRDVCGILVSPSLYLFVMGSERLCKLLCFYEDHCFLHPTALTDPDMGEFDEDRILRCLREAGVNDRKLRATERFLQGLEDYDAASAEGSRSRELTGWEPEEDLEAPLTMMVVGDPMHYDDWASVWTDLARARGAVYVPSKGVGPAQRGGRGRCLGDADGPGSD